MHPARRDLDAMDGPASAVPKPDPCAARWCQNWATLGLLCPEHGQRLGDHYGAREGHGQPGRISHGLPWMWEHLQLAYPSVTGWTSGGGGGDIDDPEAEKLAAVLSLRSDIHDHLIETAADLASRLGRHGPQATRSQRVAVLRAAAWLLAHLESLRAAQGVRATDEAHGRLLDSMAPVTAGAYIPAMDALDAATSREAVAAVLDEADGLASRAHALAPWRPAPTRIEGIPCRCGAVGTVHDHGEIRKCWRCGRGYSEDEWAALMKVFAHRFRDQEGATA